MLGKIVMGLFLVQGLFLADEVKLQGVDTIEEMSIDFSSESAAYLNSVYYKQSKADSEVLLDLYWVMECKQRVEGLDGFAKKQGDKKFVSLKKSYLEDKKAYQESMRTFHNTHCENGDDVLVSSVE